MVEEGGLVAGAVMVDSCGRWVAGWYMVVKLKEFDRCMKKVELVCI